MKLLASKFNGKKFFLRPQLYARAYVRIWTLRPWLGMRGEQQLLMPGQFLIDKGKVIEQGSPRQRGNRVIPG